MDLPPPTYPLLLGATLLLVPLVTRWARDAAERQVVRSVLLVLALLKLALILLFYSRLVCWVLAGGAAMLLSAVASPRQPRIAAGAMAPLALAAGLAFQFLPGEDGFLVYFALGLPILFGLPLAVLAASRWLRWDAGPKTVAAALAVLAFAGLLPASAFALDFLRLFEVAHLPVLLLGVAGLAWLAGRGGRRAADTRLEAVSAMDPGEYAGRPSVGAPSVVRLLIGASSVLSLAAFSWISSLGIRDFAWAYEGAIWALVAGLVSVVPLRNRTVALAAAAPAAFVAALLAFIPPAGAGYLGGRSLDVIPHLLLAGAASTLALLSAAMAWATLLDERRRREALKPAALATPGFVYRRLDGAPRVRDLEALAEAVQSAKAPGGILAVDAPTFFWTVSDEVYAWLQHQRAAQRLHVAITEAGLTYHVPPVLPEELDA